MKFFRRSHKWNTWNLEPEHPILDQSWLGICRCKLWWKHWFVLNLHLYNLHFKCHFCRISMIICINWGTSVLVSWSKVKVAFDPSICFFKWVLFQKYIYPYCTFSFLINYLNKKRMEFGPCCCLVYVLDNYVSFM